MEIWTMKIECVHGWYLEEKATKICYIQSSYNLEELCNFILEIFDFDHDHLHEFFISRKPTGNYNNRETLNDEFTTLDNIFPIGNNFHLFMHFDFGDDWVFKISRSQKKSETSSTGCPRVVKHIGKNPEQYPMCEE